jgi:predicted nucleic acid-binding protein
MADNPWALVDSNVLIDIVQRNPRWAEWSASALSGIQAPQVNPVIFAELCYPYATAEEVSDLLDALDVGYTEMPRAALHLASQAFREYRKRGGAKTSPLADFFIGAHAAVLGVPILTRDAARYQTYFPTVPLICP